MASVLTVEHEWWLWRTVNGKGTLLWRTDITDTSTIAGIIRKFPCIALGYKMDTVREREGQLHIEIKNVSLLYTHGLRVPFRPIWGTTGWELARYHNYAQRIDNSGPFIPLSGQFPDVLKIKTDTHTARAVVNNGGVPLRNNTWSTP